MSKSNNVVAVTATEEITAGLKFYEVNGKIMLGTKDGRMIRGITVPNSNLTATMVGEYIKARNEETLIGRETSKLTDISVYELRAEDEIVLNTVLATYELALRRADQWLVNKVFTEYMGKR